MLYNVQNRYNSFNFLYFSLYHQFYFWYGMITLILSSTIVQNINGSTSNGGSFQISRIPLPTDLSQNPYCIHPSENTSNSISNPPLDGKTYHSLLRSMWKVVILKNKIWFFDGSTPHPDHFDPSYWAWWKSNNLFIHRF